MHSNRIGKERGMAVFHCVRELPTARRTAHRIPWAGRILNCIDNGGAGHAILGLLLMKGSSHFWIGLIWLFGTVASLALQRPVVVSVYQGPCKEGDFEANLAAVRGVIRQAQARGSQFVAFPECFLSGYQTPLAVRQGARPLNDPALQSFIAESAQHEAVVLVGLARTAGTNLFNSVLVIHRGRLLGFYDKILLTPSDRDELGFSPGTSLPVFEAHGVRFGVLICADTSYPHVAMAAKLQGAEILFTPHNNAITPTAMEDHLRWVRNCHIGLACLYQVVVARANVVQNGNRDALSYGDSFILSPQGAPLSEAGLFRTELRTALVTPQMFEPPQVWAGFQDTPGWLRTSIADLLSSHRTPPDDAELRFWLENMAVDHQFTFDEMGAATGLDRNTLESALGRWDLMNALPRPVNSDGPIRVLPYPGGRHPRLGFFDGARNPQRETKVSVFPPWKDGGYAVVDVPEAVFSNLGLIYLAHTHIPTVWDQKGITLPRLEWARVPEGRLSLERILPNQVRIGAEVLPEASGVRFKLWLQNGTPERLSGLRIQNCVMLGHAKGFETQSLTNKVFRSPFAAVRSSDGSRWILTAWEECGRTWGNEHVPCIHSDPVFPDCPSGETVRIAGWLSFYEGRDLDGEIDRLRRLGIPSIVKKNAN